jgi:hypothetical protein
MKAQLGISLANISLTPVPPRLLMIVIQEPDHKTITELIARLALGGPFHLISNGHWLPDQDSLRRAVRRYTVAVNEILDHPIIGRPATCLQLRDQLLQAEKQPHPILILNFLHHFFDPDVDLALRQRVLEQCCQQTKHLLASKPVVVLIQHLQIEEYQQFFPILASVADEIIEAIADSTTEIPQPLLL